MNATAPNEQRSNAIWIWLLLAAGVAIVYVYFAAGGRSAPRGTVGPPVGRRLNYLQLEPLTGDSRPVTTQDLSGRVTLVNYWGTWCPPCNAEFPHILELAAQFGKDEDFRLYSVSCGGDSRNPDHDLDPLRDETEAFLKAKDATIATYADQNLASRRAMAVELELSDGFAYPTTIVFDRSGRIRGFWVGYEASDTSEMRSLIKELLAEKPKSAAG